MDDPDLASLAKTIELAWIEGDEGQYTLISLPRIEAVTYQQVLASLPARSLIERLGWQRYSWSVFGKNRRQDDLVGEADRIELLPELRADAETARQRRAAHRRKVSRTCRNP